MAKKNTVSLEGAVKTDAGLTYKGVVLEPVVEKCEGCERLVAFEGENYCPTYAQPSRKWAAGVCNFATHVRAEVEKGGKVKINPLKASKRAARGR
ncbi:PxxKW family cysteine-rich protein [Pseudodesulfovibrio sp.]|uniref:PxxKW family cysteine-rich protein n=1 Tax=unclassified Pseudodesulfovibrio TaxID=2661612 RepID=UPI003B006318